MPGSIYMRNLRLARAYSEGFEAGNGASNPHPVGTPEANAWEQGYLQCAGGTTCDAPDPVCYRGNAANTGNWWCEENGV